MRRYEFAVQIVRANAKVIPAATCANLIDDLETRALTEIQNVITKIGDTPITVQFDPQASRNA